jgi:hypothetical protein
MKINFVFFSVILIGIFVSSCTSLVFDLNQKKGPEGTINIIIHTESENNTKINFFIDNVRVGMDELKTLAKTKKKANKEKLAFPKIYGTF